MSRFAQTYEDPSYEYTGDENSEIEIMEWLNKEIDGDPEFEVPDELAKIVDGWVRLTVAEKQQEIFSPFQTSNS
jgi:hypothetical protein